MLEQAWNFIKKETPAQVFSCDFYEIFLEHLFYRTFPGVCSIVITWNHQFLEFFFLLTYPMCIYWSLCSLCICFCSTYQVITIIQTVFTLTKFVLYVCWLNKLLLSFRFRINELMQEGKKKRENSGECFTHGLGKV